MDSPIIDLSTLRYLAGLSEFSAQYHALMPLTSYSHTALVGLSMVQQ